MEPKDRIILALDVDGPEKALQLVKTLSDHVGCFKVGLEFINTTLLRLITERREDALRILDALRELFEAFRGNLFWDGKLHDIPNTVKKALVPLIKMNLKMVNVHCVGAAKMLSDAAETAHDQDIHRGRGPLLLGVTMLTSLEYSDLVDIGYFEPIIADREKREEMKRERMEWIVVRLARLAKEYGLDGAIASPKEILPIRVKCGNEFLIVSPGIRASNSPPDDQKRTMTPREAIIAGADYLVVGRPITDAADPVDAAKKIAEEIYLATA